MRWSKKSVFEELLARYVQAQESDGVKVIDATHIKAHQDACRYPEKPEKLALGKTKGGRNSKLNACVNLAGKALSFVLRPGNEHEIKAAEELLGELKGIMVLGDRGYDSDRLRKFIANAGGQSNIPPKCNRKHNIPAYEKALGRCRRVVELFFARIKRHRRINTRYDRLSESFMSFVNLAALADWIRF